jgi:hypothetical protein
MENPRVTQTRAKETGEAVNLCEKAIFKKTSDVGQIK